MVLRIHPLDRVLAASPAGASSGSKPSSVSSLPSVLARTPLGYTLYPPEVSIVFSLHFHHPRVLLPQHHRRDCPFALDVSYLASAEYPDGPNVTGCLTRRTCGQTTGGFMSVVSEVCMLHWACNGGDGKVDWGPQSRRDPVAKSG